MKDIINSENSAENSTVKTSKEPVVVWKKKACTVIDYKSTTGILAFMFDKIPCQMQISTGKDICPGDEIEIKYQGNINSNLKFKY